MSPQKTNLKVEIQNVQTLTGSVFVALFKAGSNFPVGKPTEGKKVDATSHSVQTTFSVEPGEYAVAVFHDENGNGEMDKRVFGIPKEPYGFSNNFRPKMSAPKFSDCQFTVGDGGKSISIALK
ncbi:DUF2141 domain-containing protein [Spirosoma sp.]|uniref:DUF2141 domain-containing protein n=1 Tax=Spirosoma sp. TaxID=1899569 RepID=UPI003B3ACBAF